MNRLGLYFVEQGQIGSPICKARTSEPQVGREVMGLLDRAHEDLWMPAEILIECCSATLGGADDEEIGSCHWPA